MTDKTPEDYAAGYDAATRFHRRQIHVRELEIEELQQRLDRARRFADRIKAAGMPDLAQALRDEVDK